jgi:hypothetical protein
MEQSGWLNISVTLFPVNNRHRLDRKLDVPQSQSELCGDEKRNPYPCRAKPGRPSHSLVTMPTELPRLW